MHNAHWTLHKYTHGLSMAVILIIIIHDPWSVLHLLWLDVRINFLDVSVDEDLEALVIVRLVNDCPAEKHLC